MKSELGTTDGLYKLETVQIDLSKKRRWLDYEELTNRIKDITKDNELSILINNVE